MGSKNYDPGTKNNLKDDLGISGLSLFERYFRILRDSDMREPFHNSTWQHYDFIKKKDREGRPKKNGDVRYSIIIA